MRQLNATEADTQLYGRWRTLSLREFLLRADPGDLIKTAVGNPGSGLCHFRRSAIVLLQIGDPANIDLVRQLVQATRIGAPRDGRGPGDLERRSRRLPATTHEQIMGLIAAASKHT